MTGDDPGDEAGHVATLWAHWTSTCEAENLLDRTAPAAVLGVRSPFGGSLHHTTHHPHRTRCEQLMQHEGILWNS